MQTYARGYEQIEGERTDCWEYHYMATSSG